jgi:hypothetical protein
MKWRLFLRNNSLSAPTVRVRTQMSWGVRLLLAFLAMVVAAALGVAIYEYGRNLAGPDRQELIAEIDRLRSSLREAVAERDRNSAQAMALDSQLKVQQAEQDQLAAQVRTLEQEQSRLQGDLSFFESLLPAPGKSEKGVVIRSFRLQPEADPTQMHYRLLVQQPGKPDHDFVGSVLLRVSFTQNSRGFTLDVPDPAGSAESARALLLSFRHYQRIEGSFTLPVGAQARSVQVRILAGGETHLQQTFNL